MFPGIEGPPQGPPGFQDCSALTLHQGSITMHIYIAVDGTVFSNKEDCNQYNANLN